MNTNEIKGIKKNKNTKFSNPFGNVLDDLRLKNIKHTIQSKDEYAAKDMALKLSDDKKIQAISLFESDVCKLEQFMLL